MKRKADQFEESDKNDVDEKNDDEDDSEDDDENIEIPCMGNVKEKDYTLETILNLEKKGKLNFRPYYQRQFKWKLKQSSLFVESALIGYPCPQVTFLEIDAKGNMECMDGQQRLTTLKNYTNNVLAEHWVNSRNKESGFRLKSLAELKTLENKAYKDLAENYQNNIDNYTIRCCIIPRSWPMYHVMNYFKRIQGGGLKMTQQEIRRVISQGEFTTLLDDISNSQVAPYCTLKRALDIAKVRVDPDQLQEYFLRFFTLQTCNLNDFGVPTIQDHTLETMKLLNRDCKAPEGTSKLREYERRLANALEIVLQVFPDPNHLFQRPVGLRSVEKDVTKVWSKNSRINLNIWDCIMFVFATADKATIIENSCFVHDAIVDLMQTNEIFTSKKLSKKDTQERIYQLQNTLAFLDQQVNDRPLYGHERREIIKQWRNDNKPCAICKQLLSNFDEFCHVDHTVSRACGGRTIENNLQVTHKTCNLKKGKAAM
mgnify:CR=1 FL=1